MHTCIWTSLCKNQIEILCSFFQIFLLGLLEQPIRSIMSKTAWKLVHPFVFYAIFKIENASFLKLWASIARANAAMASKDFTLFIHSLDPIDMENFMTIGQLQVRNPSSWVRYYYTHKSFMMTSRMHCYLIPYNHISHYYTRHLLANQKFKRSAYV